MIDSAIDLAGSAQLDREEGLRWVLSGIPEVLQSLMDALRDVVFFAKDLEGRYRLVNQTLVRRVGRGTKADLLGFRADEIFPDPFGAAFRLQDEAVVSSGRAIRNRLELHFYSKRVTGWCRTFKTPLVHAGQTVGLMGFSKDLDRPADDRAPAGVASAMEFLDGNLQERIQVADLARVAGMAHRSFERAVQQIFEASAGDLIIQARIDRACQLLETTEMSISVVAQECGYSEHSAFTRQFRSRVGVTPRDFRRLLT